MQPLKEILDSFKATSIMTPSSELLHAPINSSVAHCQLICEKYNFDILPIKSENDFVRVFIANSQQFSPLSRDWLISSNTALNKVIDLLCHHVSPGYFVLHNNEIVGLITLADLNKVAVRGFIYNIIGLLEYELTALLKNEFSNEPSDMLSHLSKKRQDELFASYQAEKNNNVEASIFELFYLSDIIQIIEKNDNLRRRFNFSSRNQAHEKLGGLNDLRNKTMHLVRPLVTSSHDLNQLAQRIEMAFQLLERLSNLKD